MRQIGPKAKYIPGLLVCLCCWLLPLSSQEKKTLSGVVIDRETGEALPDVQVYWVHTEKKGDTVPIGVGTVSDMRGHYELPVIPSTPLLQFKLLGYHTETMSILPGLSSREIKVEMYPNAFALPNVVVQSGGKREKYRRRGNPAVDLVKRVIANKNQYVIANKEHYKARIYTRASFALLDFSPDFNKGIWKTCDFVQNYVDTTGKVPSLTVSMREEMATLYHQTNPGREKKVLERRHFIGLEDMITSSSFQANINAIFTDVDINDNNINVLFNRFVSPISSDLATSYYQYYIVDTTVINGDQCIDLAFVPVSPENYAFTGHLYVVNDSTYKIKKYVLSLPEHANVNFVSGFQIEHTYQDLGGGIWAPERTDTYAKFYLLNRRKPLLAHQIKTYDRYDYEEAIDNQVFSSRFVGNTQGRPDTISKREDCAVWDTLRPEPLTKSESSVVELLQEFKQTPRFNALIMAADALTSKYVATVPSTRWGESKFDFGPIYSTISWNMLEGVRIRLGGMSTANLHPNCFFSGYVAFGTTDLRPKYNATLLYSFNKKKYKPYEPLRHYLSLSAQYEVEEPGQDVGLFERDHILMSIPTSKPVLKNFQYVFRAQAIYTKEWANALMLKVNFDYEHNEAAGALHYNRIVDYDGNNMPLCTEFDAYHNYELGVELRYRFGKTMPINRRGEESSFALNQDAPLISVTHKIGYLDDRATGGIGFFYNKTEITAEKRFWFSSFGHLDARLQVGALWNRAPFTKFNMPRTSTSIFLAQNSFNLMQPMEFMMDQYVGLYLTYFFKGWILNRIPGINRLGLRGVVSFSGIYGHLSNKNNPYLSGNGGLYALPNTAVYDERGAYISGYTSSPIGKLPYMELTAGLENIFKCIRIDYVRRLTYNEYQLPDGNMRKLGAWGRNGVKITVRLAL